MVRDVSAALYIWLEASVPGFVLAHPVRVITISVKKSRRKQVMGF